MQPPEAWRPEGTAPALWLLGFLTSAVGAPFLVASATAPLVQRWFVDTGHPSARDPYFLYAASNVGSIAVLLAYPFAIEPLLGMRTQAAAWALAFAALGAGMLACRLAGRPGSARTAPDAPLPAAPRAAGRERLGWLAYSAVPSCLLLGVTGHITTDVASGPLLWVVPLALYLLTFVNAFARRPLAGGRWAGPAMAWAIVLLVAVLPWREPAGLFLPLHLAVFLVVAGVCHLELARRRPEPARLTEFYLFVALGGLLGGVGVGLLAPAVFDTILEYPIALVLAAALLPGSWRENLRVSDVVVPILVLTVSFGGGAVAALFGWPLPTIVRAAVYAALAVLVLSRRVRPPGFALGVAALALVAVSPPGIDRESLWQGRSFFGVYRVSGAEDGARHLVHGTTNHGGQRMGDDGRLMPTPYYPAASPVANVFRAARTREGSLSVGIVGLGSGGLAYYRRPGDDWRYYEIDPLVVWLAADSGYFGMLDAYDPQASIVLGDARLSLAEEADGAFDLLVLDAFTSDAVPTHLLTREALDLYMRKTAPGGIVLLHLSNRLLDLTPVVAAAAADLGYAAVLGVRSTSELRLADSRGAGTAWAAVARSPSAFAGFAPYWERLEADPGVLWRDDHSSLVPVVRWRGVRREEAR